MLVKSCTEYRLIAVLSPCMQAARLPTVFTARCPSCKSCKILQFCCLDQLLTVLMVRIQSHQCHRNIIWLVKVLLTWNTIKCGLLIKSLLKNYLTVLNSAHQLHIKYTACLDIISCGGEKTSVAFLSSILLYSGGAEAALVALKSTNSVHNCKGCAKQHSYFQAVYCISWVTLALQRALTP